MSRRFRVVYSPAARDDLREIAGYILHELKSPPAAKSVTTKIRSVIRSLDEYPARFSAVEWEPWRSLGMRKARAGNFLIFYTADADSLTVTVVRILYGGRDVEKIAEGRDDPD